MLLIFVVLNIHDGLPCMAVINPLDSTLQAKMIFGPCETISDFLEQYTLEGTRRDDKSPRRINVQIFSPVTREHAKKIVEIYTRVYRGTYPFKEMLDIPFVLATFSDPKYWWGIFSLKDTIVGCFTIVTDFHTNTAYMRGLNILPEYQGQVGVRKLSYALIYRYFQDHPTILRWYTEARTAHAIVQHLSYSIGGRGCALLINKDYFFNRKETDCLMVAYQKETLTHHRIAPIILPAYCYPFYQYAKSQFNLGMDPIFITFALPTLPSKRGNDMKVEQFPQ